MNDNRGCGVEIGSVTQAMRVQRALAAAAIPSELIKSGTQGRQNRGCIYGLSFSCSQINNVRAVLAHAGIKVREWKTGD